VDGELIIWNQASGRTSFADLQRRITAGPRIVRQAREHSATYVLFDVLADPTGVLITRSLAERRRRLERLLEGAPPALQLCPQTQDLAQAREWMRTWTVAGIEGIVAKNIKGRYEPGRRRWQRLRLKTTTEAVIGGVTGTVSDPDFLLLGAMTLPAGCATSAEPTPSLPHNAARWQHA
jgi:ATP-dependent DNA ligase